MRVFAHFAVRPQTAHHCCTDKKTFLWPHWNAVLLDIVHVEIRVHSVGLVHGVDVFLLVERKDRVLKVRGLYLIIRINCQKKKFLYHRGSSL